VQLRARTLVKRARDTAMGRLMRLPRATNRYTVRSVRIPMRDGVDLVADHYAPATRATWVPAEPLLTARHVQTVTHSVHFGLSRLVLPVDASPDGVADPGGDLR
jgi:predicted acyl esterase